MAAYSRVLLQTAEMNCNINLNLDKIRCNPFRVVLGRAYHGLTGGLLLLRNFSVAISVSPHVCFIMV